MAIDILTEDVLAIADVPAWLAELGIRGKKGKPLDVRTVQYWITQGRLETTVRRICGTRYTTKQAVARMLAGETTPGREGRTPSKAQTKRRTRRDRERSHEQAMERLRAKGIA